MWALAAWAGGDACDLLAPQLSALTAVSVTQVFDGDTLQLKDGRKVRLIGVNTPELAHHDRPEEPLGKAAAEMLQRWQGKSLKLQVGQESRDRYGRVLGHVFSLQGENITARLLAEGLGFPVTIPPNTAFADCYRNAARHAEQQGKGVWHHGYFRWRSPSLEADLKGGFGRYRGQIERVKVTQKVIWIDFVGDLSLRIARQDLSYVEGGVLNRLLQAVDERRVARLPQLEVSGWVVDRTQWGAKMAQQVAAGKRNRWQLSIRHRNHWQWSTP